MTWQKIYIYIVKLYNNIDINYKVNKLKQSQNQ